MERQTDKMADESLNLPEHPRLNATDSNGNDRIKLEENTGIKRFQKYRLLKN